jgi:RNA polymerase sigma-70 factor (ECF subfamily)
MKEKNVEKIVRKYADLVYRVALTMLKNKDDAEDIFQEVFMKVCSGNVKFFSEEHEKAWIIRVTKNQCLDFLKRSCNKNKSELDENISDKDTDDNSYVFNEVMKLPEKFRLVIYLFYYEGYKINEIAKMLDENESTLKSRLVKARALLKESLKEEF